MKKLSSLLLIALLAITSISCSDDEDVVVVPVSATPVSGDGFRWTDSSSSTEQTVNNPYANNSFKTIFATNTGSGTVYEINLTAIAVGTYDVVASGNAFYYRSTTMSAAFVPTSGSVVITANANNKLTGTFTATGSGGGVTSVSGSFTNIAIN
ncbi:hypothetical protein SAMN05660845_0398 [Flavobacterium swingsii]|uniref:DUF642 domain-containing protein n=1 Tax=Flavobacterium swingsii TaxID=498292 RepID=A0A1I0VHK2_9FLAO|nr:hypothetical protein [Flavobacterium swingsii]SFA75792.1 hypothetical protein SAMN05660845_0398 [Flavobacterium swingsii]